ncbi:hypothetical protein [Halalkalibacter alkaliphilus]|uniref:Uncharacterized protein n=1 Tax=Halalkalibacter alkaliphilus TaxID=2917993 RepID=A0A9X2A4N2_9BACI|nr:hypothetical protein [Halalkalibacter alkaliphilus]MCL7746798.1 hypothetical protein [Halalkalibacter alkaliphilus]
MADQFKHVKKGLEKHVFNQHSLDQEKMIAEIKLKRKKSRRPFVFWDVKPVLSMTLFCFVMVTAGALFFLKGDEFERLAIEDGLITELSAIPDPYLQNEIEENELLQQRFMQDLEFRTNALSGKTWYWSEGEIRFLEEAPTLDASYENEFLVLPEHIQEVIHDDPFVLLAQFNENEDFRERLSLASEKMDEFQKEDVYTLLKYDENIGRSGLYKRGEETIFVEYGSVYRRIYDQFYETKITQKKQLILDDLYVLASSFYLQQDGFSSKPTQIEEIDEAEALAEAGSIKDYRQISYQLSRDSREKNYIIYDTLRLALDEDVSSLHQFLSRIRNDLEILAEQDQVISQYEYSYYYQAARELFILNEVLNEPLPVEFIDFSQPLSNQEVVEEIAREKK